MKFIYCRNVSKHCTSVLALLSPHAQNFHSEFPLLLNQILSQVKNRAVFQDSFRALPRFLLSQALLPSYNLHEGCTKEARALFKSTKLRLLLLSREEMMARSSTALLQSALERNNNKKVN